MCVGLGVTVLGLSSNPLAAFQSFHLPSGRRSTFFSDPTAQGGNGSPNMPDGNMSMTVV